MSSGELLVVVLNQSNEELNLLPDSPNLTRGEWTDACEARPPQEILAGECGMWRIHGGRIGKQIEGSVAYQIVGYDSNTITFSWKVYMVRSNEFQHSCTTNDFEVQVINGGGKPAIAIFIFKPAKIIDL
ncbi:hypothetical protein BGZ63DRAFT_389580 [Mariannaea sp. PMI_226]|nr:hypothetical protein BGZ63DRAFT_389580 [Mariannaea sp. PMI_226]